MRLLVCGSRTWTDWTTLASHIEAIVNARPAREAIVLIHGDAPGADQQAGKLARIHGWMLQVYPATWQRDGRAAGPRRNVRMLRDGEPHLVLAFVDKPLDQSRGTAHMVGIARHAGIPVQIIERR
jgi:hypothetical protein